jgi:hypothetical protein
MREYPTSQGRFTFIDNADWELVSRHKWAAHNKGDRWYVKGYVNGDIIGLHTYLMNPPPGYEVDHINNDGEDNRRSNLRIVTRSQNLMNRRANKKGTSQYIGVYHELYTGRWCAAVKKDGKIWRQRCNSEIEAAELRDEMAKEWFGEYARLNFND